MWGDGLVGSEPTQGSRPYCPQDRIKQALLGLWSRGLSSGNQPLLSAFPSRKTPPCFPAWKNHRIMNEGQGHRVRRVEGPCPPLRVCLWVLSLQAEEEDPAAGGGPSRPRKRYWRAWVGGQSAMCFGLGGGSLRVRGSCLWASRYLGWE